MFAYYNGLVDRPLHNQYSLPVTEQDKSSVPENHHPDLLFDEDLDYFFNNGDMAGTGMSSPFIKDEPDDFNFNTSSYVSNQQGYALPMNQQFGANAASGIDPSELTMQTGSFNQVNYGPQSNLSSSFHLGNSVIGDDELLDLDLNDISGNHGQFVNGQQFGQQNHPGMQDAYSSQGQSAYALHHNQNQMHHVLSSTPDGAPIQSPFVHGNFNYAQFSQMQPQQTAHHISPHMRPSPGLAHRGSIEGGYMNARPRSRLSHGMDRRPSDSRSPLTPKTPALGGMHLGTPDSGAMPIQTNGTHQGRHQKSQSNHWDNTSGSLHSYVDSPLSSPGHQASHAQISEILKSGKPASLPAKVDTATHPAPTYQTQEAKRRRRRESHNMVERRRRDNINDRIQELSHLVPQHRLEDERIRKHIVNNSPLSPPLVATGMSPPPQATSLLAGGGRRATSSNITMGIPADEKDKGPNKGDILNGAVSWTRDLMWALHVKLQQESELADYITSLGGVFPFEPSEDEKRMRSELMDAFELNSPDIFAYSRGPGSGLRVPKHTNVAGDPINGQRSPQSLSPGVQSGGSGANSGGQGQPQFWSHNTRGNTGFKEEEEYGMEMG